MCSSDLITDRCNFRCTYCMPSKGFKFNPHREILTFEEMLRVIKVGIKIGVRKVRITGGEPMVRKGLVGFIERLSRIEGIDDISMTTNGSLLKANIERLKKAGLRRINISLDTLKPERFSTLTGASVLEDVLSGIEAAIEYELTPVKINCVLVRGFNDDEIMDFISLTKDKPINIRFIEFMPLGNGKEWSVEKMLPSQEIKEKLTGLLEPYSVGGCGPAENFRINGHTGSVGFISPISNHFCSKCNRIRLTADGRLKSCLESNEEVDIKTIMRSGGDDEAILKGIGEAILAKPQEHTMDKAPHKERHRFMSQIGG